MGNVPFIQFPFIEVPKELYAWSASRTPSTRAYRREGTFKECGEWLETLSSHKRGRGAFNKQCRSVRSRLSRQRL